MLILSCGGCDKSDSSTSGYENNSNEITLRWVLPFAEQSDYQMVEDTANEMLAELLPDTKLQLVLDSSMGDKWSLWMSGKTSFDIAQSGYANDLQTEIMNNSYLPLNDLINEYAPTIKQEMTDYEASYFTGTYNNQLYAIPNIQYYINVSAMLRISDSISQYFDIKKLVDATYSSPKTTEEFYQILDECITKADAARSESESKVYVDIARFYNIIAKRGYIFIGGSDSNICYDPYADTVKVIDFYETDEFKMFVRYANKWYTNGNIPKDVLTGTTGDVSRNIVATNGSRYNMDENSTRYWAADKQVLVCLNNPDYDILGSYTIGSIYSYLSIPFTAQNPERAIKLIELLRTEEGADLLNLLVYGIEGVHYEKTSDTTIKAFDYEGQGTSSSKYGIPNWMMGNLFNMYVVDPYDYSIVEYGNDYYQNYIKTVKRTSLYGFSFNIQNVKSLMSQILSIDKEYEPQIAYGVLSDYQSTYETLISRLDTAGLSQLITEFQNQADEYTASK